MSSSGGCLYLRHMTLAAAGLGGARAPSSSRHSRVGGARARAGKRGAWEGRGGPNLARRRQGRARSAQVRRVREPSPARRRQGPARSRPEIPRNFPKFVKFPKIRQIWPKLAKIGQKRGKKGPKISRPVQLIWPNFKIFGKNAFSGHHLGKNAILARRGVSSLFRFMRNDPSPYRTNKRLSEFNSGL